MVYLCSHLFGGFQLVMEVPKNGWFMVYDGKSHEMSMVYLCSHLFGGFQLVMGVPQARWMVYFRENLTERDDDRGVPLF